MPWISTGIVIDKESLLLNRKWFIQDLGTSPKKSWPYLILLKYKDEDYVHRRQKCSQTSLIRALKGPERVSVLRGSCCQSKKKLLLEQNTKEIKEDLSIVKLNFSNLHKAVITRLKCTETSKNGSFIVLLRGCLRGGRKILLLGKSQR